MPERQKSRKQTEKEGFEEIKAQSHLPHNCCPRMGLKCNLFILFLTTRQGLTHIKKCPLERRPGQQGGKKEEKRKDKGTLSDT